mmetsp:Transcript_4470/g.10835  ORF Transcript_4470/g.10835 Transcript_4470/m.10835 type:complete len:84 (-) Transcript_4470:171-422(-)
MVKRATNEASNRIHRRTKPSSRNAVETRDARALSAQLLGFVPVILSTVPFMGGFADADGVGSTEQAIALAMVVAVCPAIAAKK